VAELCFPWIRINSPAFRKQVSYRLSFGSRLREMNATNPRTHLVEVKVEPAEATISR
jgi:hypothetical protein